MALSKPATREYLLPRDNLESQRLNDQHELYLYTLGYMIHPSIKPALKVADIGCGTGVFLAALRVQQPKSTLVGYDISSEQFPEQLPPNILLKTHDLSEPFHMEEQGTFDLVHLRLVGQGLRPDQWTKAVSHATSLLRAGGYLLWIEPDHIYKASIVSSTSSSPATTSLQHKPTNTLDSVFILERLFAYSLRHAIDLHWDRESEFACSLRKLIEDDDTIDSVREDLVPIDWSDHPRARTIQIDNSLSIFRAGLVEGLAQGLKDKELGLLSMDDVDRILGLARREMEERGYRYRYWIHAVVGRRRMA